MKKQEICAIIFFTLFIIAAGAVESNCIISIICIVGMCIAARVGNLSRVQTDSKE